jgi:TPR repeat protein
MCVDREGQPTAVTGLATRLTEARKLYKQGVELLQHEDHRQAGDCILHAAQLGDSTAQCHLGFLYENGFFGQPNDYQAVQWYRKAADQCLPHGQFRLGTCYQLGKGVRQDWEEAARLFDLAARMGHKEAAQCLESLRKMGVGSD